jgi:hypothetical protein
MIGDPYFEHQQIISKFLSNSVLTANMAGISLFYTILSVFLPFKYDYI